MKILSPRDFVDIEVADETALNEDEIFAALCAAHVCIQEVNFQIAALGSQKDFDLMVDYFKRLESELELQLVAQSKETRH